MSEGIRYLTEQDVVSTLDIRRAIDALEDMLAAQGRGEAKNLPKTLTTWGEGNSMHALGSVMINKGYAGFKTWVYSKSGGGSIFSLFDSQHGTLLGLIEARALGMLRTAAISGVATRLLASRDIRTAALIGTGPQAVTQLAALAAVQDLDEVRVFSPTAEKRKAFAQNVAARYPFPVRACDTLEEALDGAGIVTVITRAQEPFLNAANLKDCRHLNAVGAILPAKAEFHQDVFERADLVVVDDLENAQRGSRELREHFGAGPQGWGEVKVLSDLLAANKDCPLGTRFSIFKGMGMGLSDLAMASVAYELACQRDLGISLPRQTRENLLLTQV
ncbi:ornithine cyclodeaminase family protein [Paralcaligenes ginsengisoli]